MIREKNPPRAKSTFIGVGTQAEGGRQVAVNSRKQRDRKVIQGIKGI